MLNRSVRQRAQVIVWVVVMFPFFLAIAGLSIDAGRIFDARREAQNVADGAARVASTQIDLKTLHDTGKVQLNDQAAAEAARYVTAHTPGSGWDKPGVNAIKNGQQTVAIEVTVSRHLPTTFMRIVNPKQEVTVSAVARAQPCVGITTGQTPTGDAC